MRKDKTGSLKETDVKTLRSYTRKLNTEVVKISFSSSLILTVFSSGQCLWFHCNKMFFVANEDPLWRERLLNHICRNRFQNFRWHPQWHWKVSSEKLSVTSFQATLYSFFWKLVVYKKTQTFKCQRK